MGKLSIDLSSVTTAGLDLAKHVFFVHAVDDEGALVVAKEIRRRDFLTFFKSIPACRVGVDPLRCWAQRLIETKPFKLVAVAIANKLARIVVAILRTGTSYRTATA